MKYIIFADSAKTIEDVVKEVGENSVAAIYDFSNLANQPSDDLPDLLPLNGLEEFLHGGGGSSFNRP